MRRNEERAGGSPDRAGLARRRRGDTEGWALLRPAALLACVAMAGCKAETRVDMFVDGFQPKNVRFEVEDLGHLDASQLRELDKRPDVDGVLYLPASSCGGPCKAAMVSVFVHNMDADAKVEPAPVIRIKSPSARAARLPIAFRGGQIEKGRIGRIRWVVEMWPEEQSLTATLSSSVQLVDTPASAQPAAPAPQAPKGDP